MIIALGECYQKLSRVDEAKKVSSFFMFKLSNVRAYCVISECFVDSVIDERLALGMLMVLQCYNWLGKIIKSYNKASNNVTIF